MSASVHDPHAPPSEEEFSDRLRFALDMVGQMNAIGLTAVPVKPTRDMLLAGAKAAGITVESAWAVWTAMLNAAD